MPIATRAADRVSAGQGYDIVPPEALERLVRPMALAHAAKPKKGGETRSIAFPKELPREVLKHWNEAWHLLA